jgi:hypothetical protein
MQFRFIAHTMVEGFILPECLPRSAQDKIGFSRGGAFQNLAGRKLSIIPISSRTNQIEDLLPFVEAILHALETMAPGQIAPVGEGGFYPQWPGKSAHVIARIGLPLQLLSLPHLIDVILHETGVFSRSGYPRPKPGHSPHLHENNTKTAKALFPFLYT